MRREDWLWLLLKAAGLWLIVTAVETASMENWFTDRMTESYAAGREQLLRMAIPLASGLCLLMVDFKRWLPVVPAESSPNSEQASSMTRSDWLWVGIKIVGAYYAMLMVFYFGQFFSMTGGRVSSWVVAMAGPVVGLGLALWLLMGDTVWRVASREPAARGVDAARPSRAGSHMRDVCVVCLVFAVLGAIPIVLVWWVGSS